MKAVGLLAALALSLGFCLLCVSAKKEKKGPLVTNKVRLHYTT